MYDSTIEIRGYVAADPVARDVAGTQVAQFRVGATPRYLNKTTGQWVDAATQWFSVSAWRRTAENVSVSLRKGDAVIVRGRLSVREWADRDGVLRTSLDIDADAVGFDLARGTGRFSKNLAAPLDSTSAPAEEFGDLPEPSQFLEGPEFKAEVSAA